MEFSKLCTVSDLTLNSDGGPGERVTATDSGYSPGSVDFLAPLGTFHLGDLVDVTITKREVQA